MRSFFCVVLLSLIPVVGLLSDRDQANESASGVTPLVQTWFERWNALDGSIERTNAFLELYHLDAVHLTGPASHQQGTVTFRGHDAIRKMAEDFSEANEKVIFRIDTSTSNERSDQLFHVASGPWDGPSAAVEYIATYTRKKDNQRFYGPGGAFFQIQDGKIRRARFYMSTGELAEVEPDLPPR
jgi:ketosteroid isomerase-like protein